MDKQRITGTKHQIKGAIKETVGKLTGDKRQEAAGSLEKNAGKLQKAYGKAKDTSSKTDKP